jgi:hypothetical protein
MKTYIASIVCCLLTLSAWSQDRRLSQLNLEQLANTSPAGPGFMTFDNDGMQIEGTPFLFDDWKTGRVRLEDQEEFSDEVGIILDLQDDQIYIQLNSDFVSEFPVNKVGAVEIYNEQDTFLFETFDLNKYYGIGPKGLRFYEVLHKGQYTVLHGHKKYLRKEDYVEKLGMVTRPNEFKSLHSYWLDNGKSIQRVKKRTSSVRSAIAPKDARKVKRIVKSNDLKIKKDKDFGALFRLLEEEKTR